MVSFVDKERFLGEGARTKAQPNVKASCWPYADCFCEPQLVQCLN